MTKVLLVSQDKGGTGKTIICRGLCEILPGAPVFEIDSSPRMIELGKRVKFFPMRADRDEIERTGGTISRAEFDQVINAIASATLPTIVDIGANTGASLLGVIAGLTDDFTAAGVEFGLLVVTTAEPGAVAEVPKLLSIAAPWTTARFLIENRIHGDIDPKILLKIASGARVTCLMKQVMDENAAAILQAGGLASIAELDAKAPASSERNSAADTDPASRSSRTPSSASTSIDPIRGGCAPDPKSSDGERTRTKFANHLQTASTSNIHGF